MKRDLLQPFKVSKKERDELKIRVIKEGYKSIAHLIRVKLDLEKK